MASQIMLYIVSCYIDGQKSPCMMQAYFSKGAAEKRAAKARETFPKVTIHTQEARG